jgi:hypothetical protein
LQIDEGQLGSTITNPAEESSNPAAPGQSYNSILEGAPSNNGTSTGTSGTGMSSTGSNGVGTSGLGVGTTSPLQSTYPKRLTTPTSPFSNQFGNSFTPGAGTTFRPSTGLTNGLSSGVGRGMNSGSFARSPSGGHSGGLR